MDFLDYEEETEINESDSPHQSITKLLDNRELLQELRATPSIASFLETHAALVLKAALTKDGEVDDDDDTVDQKQRYTPADRRAYVASEVLCGPASHNPRLTLVLSDSLPRSRPARARGSACTTGHNLCSRAISG